MTLKRQTDLTPLPKATFHSIVLTNEEGTRTYAHFYHFLVHDRDRNLLYSKGFLLFSQIHPFSNAIKQVVTELHDMAQQTSSKLQLEPYLHNMLFEITIPAPGNTIKASPAKTSIVMIRPNTQKELDYCYVNLVETIRSVGGIGSFLDLITAVLLEKLCVLISSKNREAIFNLYYAIECVIQPFQYEHRVVLPVPMDDGLMGAKQLMEMLGCWIVGYVVDDSLEPLVMQQHILHVDIDAKKIILPVDHDRQVGLPYRDTIFKHLEKLISAVEEEEQKTLSEILPVNVNFSDQLHSQGEIKSNLVETYVDAKQQAEMRYNIPIREIFFSMFTDIFHNYENNISTACLTTIKDEHGYYIAQDKNSSKSFETHSFLADSQQDHIKFLSFFLQSQLFTNFAHDKVENKKSELEEKAEEEEDLKRKKCEDLKNSESGEILPQTPRKKSVRHRQAQKLWPSYRKLFDKRCSVIKKERDKAAGQLSARERSRRGSGGNILSTLDRTIVKNIEESSKLLHARLQSPISQSIVSPKQPSSSGSSPVVNRRSSISPNTMNDFPMLDTSKLERSSDRRNRVLERESRSSCVSNTAR